MGQGQPGSDSTDNPALIATSPGGPGPQLLRRLLRAGPRPLRRRPAPHRQVPIGGYRGALGGIIK